MNMKKKSIACALSVLFILSGSEISTSTKKSDKHSKHSSAKAQKEKKKKNRTTLGTTLGFGALGSIAAGAFGGGKWVPLGLVGGTLAGWAIGKAAEHRKNKKAHKNSYIMSAENEENE